MANNRLYFGDTKTKDYIFLEKGWGAGWDGGWFDGELMQKFIEQVYTDGDLGAKTSLVFFTEYDDCYDDFITNGIKRSKENL